MISNHEKKITINLRCKELNTLTLCWSFDFCVKECPTLTSFPRHIFIDGFILLQCFFHVECRQMRFSHIVEVNSEIIETFDREPVISRVIRTLSRLT